MRNVQQTFSNIVEQVPYLPEELQVMVANVDDPSALAHLIAGALRLPTEEKQELLEEVDVAKRLRRLSEILARELEVVALGSKIQSQVQSELDKGQREYFLRQQLKAIQEELGEADEVQAEVNELREQLGGARAPRGGRASRSTASSPGSSGSSRRWPSTASIRAYLEWIAALPWDKSTEDNLDLEHAREVLDEDHYDLEKVKERILEYLAVAEAEAGRARLDPVLRRAARASARPRSAGRSRGRSGASSSGSASAACATRPRSAATGAPTSARCRARSSARCATPAPTTRCS